MNNQSKITRAWQTIITLLMVVLPANIFSQVPNSGFEQWTSGAPDGWYTSNVPSFATPVTQSSANHSGSSALHGEVVSTVGGAYGPIIEAGDGGGGFPISQRYATFNGYFQFSPVGGDQAYFLAYVVKNNTAIGLGSWIESTAVASYTQFAVPIAYFSSDTPDTCHLTIEVTGSNGNPYHVGSYILVDDLTLSGSSTSVAGNTIELTPQQFSLRQNYPNPFNPTTTIRYTLPIASRVLLTVENLLGENVATLVNGERQAGTYDIPWNATGQPSGMFIYKMEAGNFRESKRLILLK